jgi:hypothetical protein
MNNPFPIHRNILFILLVIVFLAACTSQPVIPPTETYVPAETTQPPTITNTSVPPTATSTPTFTETPTASPTDTYTPTSIPSPSFTPTETPSETPKPATAYFPENAIKIYLTHLGTGGPVACGDSLVAIYTGYVRTGNIENDIKLAVDTLFSIGQYSGALYNATYPSSLRVGGVILEKGVATVELGGSYQKPKDACDASRYRAQVWSTILQFPEITRAIPTHNNALLGDLLAVYSDSGK